MHQRDKNREAEAPLVVKEIILPEKEKSNLGHGLINTPIFADLKKEEMTENVAGSSLKIGSHQVKPIPELVILEKKVRETYFEGTRQEKRTRRKVKQQREPQFLNELLFKNSQKSEGLEIQTESDKSLSPKDIIQRRDFQQKLQRYEKMKEHSDRSNYRKQRLAEKKYIQQQENLAETWLGYIKRRNQLRQDGLLNLKPSGRETLYNDRIAISVISREFWNDGQDESSSEKLNKKHEKKPKEMADDLGDIFFEKVNVSS